MALRAFARRTPAGPTAANPQTYYVGSVKNEFQALAAAAAKARSPSVERRVDGISSVNVSADRR